MIKFARAVMLTAFVAGSPACLAASGEKPFVFNASTNVLADVLAVGRVGLVAAELEYRPSPWISVYAAPGWVLIDTPPDFVGTWNGPILLAGARLFPLAETIRGLFVSLEGHVHDGPREGLDSYGAGVSVGYRFEAGSFTVTLAAGARYLVLSQYNSPLIEPSFTVAPGFSF